MGGKKKGKVPPRAKSARQQQKRKTWFYSTLEAELEAIGLRIKQMAPDGNCFFRAVADQLHGDAGSSADVRKQVVDHMEANADHYAPFVEFDEGFDSYTTRMRKTDEGSVQDGVWAGNMEVQATSMCFGCNISIFQQGQPCWRTINFTPPESCPCLYLSYHDGDHYNSVRLHNDFGKGPPETIDLIRRAVDGAAFDADECVFGEREMKQVAENTYCFDKARVQRALQRCSGNADAAVEWLIEDMAKDAEPTAADQPANGSQGQAPTALGNDAASNEQSNSAAAGGAEACQGDGSPERAASAAADAEYCTAAPAPCGASGLLAQGAASDLQCAATPAAVESAQPADATAQPQVAQADASHSAVVAPREQVAAIEASVQASPDLEERAAPGSAACADPEVMHVNIGPTSAVNLHAAGPAATPADAAAAAVAAPADAAAAPADVAAAAVADGEQHTPPARGGKKRKGAKSKADATGKRPANNKLCPCSSGRKYKNCCKAKDDRKAGSEQAARAAHAAVSRGSAAAVHLSTLDI